MKRLLLVAAIAVLVPWHRGAAARDATETVTDEQFVRKAAAGGATEVEAGKMALRISQTGEVKSFAQRMIDDHNRVNQRLRTTADRKQIRIPIIIEPQRQQALDRLARLRGPDFDKAYAEQMLKDHKATLTLFEAEARDGKDAEIKALATDTVPVLEKHMEMARTLAGRFGTSVKSAERP